MRVWMPGQAVTYPVELVKSTLWMSKVHYRRRGRYRITVKWDGVLVEKEGKRGEEPEWVEWFPQKAFTYEDLCGDESMASRYISAAVGKHEQKPNTLCISDKVLFVDRPALAEFMGLVVDDDGQGREPSVLMVCLTATGVRVGLKDDQAGGWLWREADTLLKCLNSIESALVSGNVTWAVPGGHRGKKR